MTDDILQMRGITKTFPGVKALQDVNLTVRRGEIHAICGENGAGKSTLMKVLSGVLPARLLRRRDRLRRRAVPFSGHPGQRAPRHRDHPPGAGAVRAAVRSRRTSSSATSRPRRGLIDWNRTNHEAAGAAATGSACGRTRRPRSLDLGVGKQQLVEIAKALSKRGQPADPRRADRRAQRRGLRAPARPAARPARRGHHLRDHLAQAQRGHRDRRHRHDPARRPDHRDADPRDGAHRGPDHLRHGRPRPGAPVPAAHARRSATRCCAIEDWTVHSPTQRGPGRGRERHPVVAARRDRRSRRPDGRGPHRARDERLRPLVRRRTSPAGSIKDGREIDTRTVRDAIRARHRLRHRGPQALRAQPDRGHQAQRLRGGAGQARQRAAGWTRTRSTRSRNGSARA